MSDKLTAVVAGVFFTIIWSVSFLVGQDAVAVLSPLALLSLRYCIVGTLLCIVYYRSVIKFWNGIDTRTKIRVLFSGLLAHGVYLGCNFWVLETMPSSVVNIIVSSLPLFVIPCAYLILNEPVRLINVVAVSLAIFGVFVTIDTGNTINGQDFNGLEIFLVVFSVIALAFGNVLTKTFINRTNFLQVCGIQFLASGIALIPFAVVIDGPLQMQILFDDYLPHLLFMVFIPSIVGTVLWFRVLDTFSANGASSFFLLTPVMGIVLGFIFFAEPITYGKVIGGGIITASIALKVSPHVKRILTR